MERVFAALVAAEEEAGEPVSAFDICQELARSGHVVRSYRAAIWRLCADRRVWRAGVGYSGKNSRYARVYTAREERGVRGPADDSLMTLRVPPELHRAIRDVVSGARAVADGLARVDDLLETSAAAASDANGEVRRRRRRLAELGRRLDARLPRRFDDT